MPARTTLPHRLSLYKRWFEKKSNAVDGHRRSWLRDPIGLGAEGWFAIVALLIGTGLFSDLLWGTSYAALANISIWMILSVVGMFLLIKRSGLQWIQWTLLKLPALLLLLAWTMLSCIWSFDPRFTFVHAVLLIGTSCLGLFIGLRFAGRDLMRVITLMFSVFIVINLMIIFVIPEYGIEAFHRGYLPEAWKGALSNKNILGRYIALAFMVFLIGTAGNRLPVLFGSLMCILSAIMLFMTQAMTAIIGLAGGLLVMLVFMLGKRIRLPSLIVLLLLLCGFGAAVWWFAQNPEPLTATIGRDETLTHRTDVWRDGLKAFSERPLTGYGYRIVWGRGAETWFHDLPTTSWAGHAHNGLVQIVAELGAPGLLLAITYTGQVLFLAVGAFSQRYSPSLLLFITLICMLLFMNLLESMLFMGMQSFWILFVMMSVALARLSASTTERGGFTFQVRH